MGFHVTVKENQERTYLGTNGFFKDAIGPNAETDRTMAIMRIIELKTTKYIVRMWQNGYLRPCTGRYVVVAGRDT